VSLHLARTWRRLRLFATQERHLAIRSRWTVIFAVLFAVLALAVGGSGYILTGGRGLQDFARTAVSLVQLVLLLVPLTSLMIGVMALTPERGAVEFVFAQPVSRGLVLFGRLLGLFEALAAAQLVGFGASGLVIFSRAGREGLETFVVLVLGSLALTAIFLGLAALIATTSVGRRGRALAIAVVGWFVAVVVFDVAALGLASMLRSGTASRVLIGAVLVNPVDTVRTATLLAVEGDAAFGAASLAFFRVLGGTRAAAIALATSGVIWIVVPALVAWRRLEAADL
jgi:Cu-processing system permease protein